MGERKSVLYRPFILKNRFLKKKGVRGFSQKWWKFIVSKKKGVKEFGPNKSESSFV
jgi:hypothetical protein